MPTYYVDATGGNDLWDGLSPATAWQTIAHVNAQAFLPGDSVLFKRGETWVGTCLTIPTSGAAGNVITFADYGTGNLPVIDGNDAVECINATNRSYITFQNIEVSQGLNYGFNLNAAHHIEVVDCVGHDCGNDGVAITGAHHITVTGGVYYDQYQRVGGTTTSGITIEDNSHDVEIRGVICHSTTGTAGQGITIHNHVLTTFPYNVTIYHCECYDNSQCGIHILKQDATVDADRNIIVNGCYSHDNSIHGIYISTTSEVVNGVTLHNTFSGYCATQRALYCNDSDNVTVTRCAFIGGPAWQPILVIDCQQFSLLNCVAYAVATQTGSDVVQISGARTQNCVIKNNIVYAGHTGCWMLTVQNGTGVVGMDIDYNLYSYTGAGSRWLWLIAGCNWANWLVTSGQDANSPVPAAPQFIDPTVDNFMLQRTSPALNIGTDVGFAHRGDAPDLGRFEMQRLSQVAHAQMRPLFIGE